jgi:putative oxidoreductase
MAEVPNRGAIASEAPNRSHGAKLIIPGLASFYDRAYPLSYAALRIAWGLTLVAHGLPKIMGTAHGSMADPMAGSTRLFSETLGLPFAAELALFVAVLEFAGRLMIAAGLLTRLVAPMVAVQMAVICWLLDETYPWIDQEFEYPLMLGLPALLIAFGGGGPLSADRMIGRELSRARRYGALRDHPPASPARMTDELRYARPSVEPAPGGEAEFGAVKIRYKLPAEDQSREIVERIRVAEAASTLAEASDDARFSAAVAAVGQKLRRERHVEAMGWDEIAALANGAKGADPWGYRAGFVRLVGRAKAVSSAAP